VKIIAKILAAISEKYWRKYRDYIMIMFSAKMFSN
jgi:hypothetical protein